MPLGLARKLIVGGLLVAMVMSAAGPVLAGVRCALDTPCCPCGSARPPAVPTAATPCCCAVKSPDQPAPPAPVTAPAPPIGDTLVAAPPVASVHEDIFAALLAGPVETRPAGPDPPPLWLLTASLRR